MFLRGASFSLSLSLSLSSIKHAHSVLHSVSQPVSMPDFYINVNATCFIILSVIYAECCNNSIMLNVIMLSAKDI